MGAYSFLCHLLRLYHTAQSKKSFIFVFCTENLHAIKMAEESIQIKDSSALVFLGL